MTLKQAARTLGVHYQTVYRWVRSGELAAIKLGSRYEVSEIAIAELLANRDGARSSGSVAQAGHEIRDLHRHDELQLIARSTRANPTALLEAVVRHLTRDLCDSASVRLVSADGERLDLHAVAVADPSQASAVHAAAMRVDLPTSRTVWEEALQSGVVQSLDHVPVNVSKDRLGPRTRLILGEISTYSVALAPLVVDGLSMGVVTAVRFSAGRPFLPHELDELRLVAEIANSGLERADRFSATWNTSMALRTKLASALDGLDRSDALDRGAVGESLSREQNAAVFAVDGSLLGATERFASRAAVSLSSLKKTGVRGLEPFWNGFMGHSIAAPNTHTGYAVPPEAGHGWKQTALVSSIGRDLAETEVISMVLSDPLSPAHHQVKVPAVPDAANEQ